MYKKIFYFILFSFFITLFSCSSDKENEPLPDDSTNDPELLQFVGYWIDKANNWNLMFYDNGTCNAIQTFNNQVMREGIWSYDPSTNLLTNSATQSTFLITLISDTNFMGVDISNNKTVTYVRDNDNPDAVRLAFNGYWVNEDGGWIEYNYVGTTSSSNLFPELPPSTDRVRYRSQALSISSDQWKIVYTLERYYGIENKWYTELLDSKYWGYLSYENLFSPSKTTFTFNYILSGTYKRVNK